MTDGKIRMDGVASRAEVEITSQDVEAREADGGSCTVIRIEGEGPVTSADPRLEGTFKASAVILLDDAGNGVSRDDWEIVDAETGERKVWGTAHGIHDGANPVKALSVGELHDGSRFFAHARVALPQPGSGDPIVIEYGGPGLTDPGNRAVAVSGELERLLS